MDIDIVDHTKKKTQCIAWFKLKCTKQCFPLANDTCFIIVQIRSSNGSTIVESRSSKGSTSWLWDWQLFILYGQSWIVEDCLKTFTNCFDWFICQIDSNPTYISLYSYEDKESLHVHPSLILFHGLKLFNFQKRKLIWSSWNILCFIWEFRSFPFL